MRDNELMVRRTIDEFKELYAALVKYFEGDPAWRKRFFHALYVYPIRHQIPWISSPHIKSPGYTGGESLEQIVLDSEVRALPVQSYAPETAGSPFSDWRQEPMAPFARGAEEVSCSYSESLPNYRRPI
jgi:hypothetical protein